MNENGWQQGLPAQPVRQRDRQLPNPAYEPELPRNTGDGSPMLTPIAFDADADPDDVLQKTRMEMNYVLRKALRSVEKKINAGNTSSGQVAYVVKVLAEELVVLRKGGVQESPMTHHRFDPDADEETLKEMEKDLESGGG